MTHSNFSILLTEDEKIAFNALAQAAYPDMKKGAKAALFRDWLSSAAESAGIEIVNRTTYGDPARFKNLPVQHTNFEYGELPEAWSDEDYKRLNALVAECAKFCAWTEEEGSVRIEQREPRSGEVFWISKRWQDDKIYITLMKSHTSSRSLYDEWNPDLVRQAFDQAVTRLENSD